MDIALFLLRIIWQNQIFCNNQNKWWNDFEIGDNKPEFGFLYKQTFLDGTSRNKIINTICLFKVSYTKILVNSRVAKYLNHFS